MGVARNIALSLARGKYCVILDDDDVFLPGWPDAAITFLENERKCVAVYGDTYLGDDTHKIGETHEPVTPEILLDRGNFIGTSAMVWRTNPFLQHEETFWCCDPYDVWIQIARSGRIAHIPHKAFVNRASRLQNSASVVYSCPECYKAFREAAV